MTRIAKIKLISWIISIGLLVAIPYHYYFYITGLKTGDWYPLGTFLCPPVIRFGDFADVYGAVLKKNPYHTYQAVYFPAAYAVMLGLSQFKLDCARWIYFVGFGATLYYIVYSFTRLDSFPVWGRMLSAVIISFCTYPFIFLIDRGNIEGLVFLTIAGTYLCFRNERYGLASALIATGAALKGYPIVFAVLFLNRRLYPYFFMSVFLAFLAEVASLQLFLLPVKESLAGFRHSLYLFNLNYVFLDKGLSKLCSLLSTVKVTALTIACNNANYHPDIGVLVRRYTSAILLSLAYMAFHVIVIEKVLWRKFSILLIAIVVLPSVSYDYKLIHVVLLALIYSERKSRSKIEDLTCGILISSTIIPKEYLFLNFLMADSWADISWNVFYNPPVLSALGLFWMWQGWRERKISEGTGGTEREAETGAVPLLNGARTSWQRSLGVRWGRGRRTAEPELGESA
jgi:hypothetical protein